MSNNLKIKIYRLLGAEIFQKVVFKAEDIKYLIMDKLFPNINNWYERICNKKYNKMIEKQNLSEEEKQQLLTKIQLEKMKFRKENNYKQNRNYHYNPNKPIEFLGYLNINKKIHLYGAFKNIFLLLIIKVLSLIFIDYIVILNCLALYECISLFINFQCINLQNYNISRFEDEKIKTLLEKKEKRQLQKNIQKYDKCIEPVSNIVNKQIELPTVDDIVNQITTHEQAVQLLNYAKEQLNYMENNTHTKRKEKHL